MTTFIVEHLVGNKTVIEKISGVEDIDVSMFPNLITSWTCENEAEINAVENELRKKHERRS